MKPDNEIRRDVEEELRWSPDVDETDVAVKVNDGVVSLTGFVRSYFEKYRAEDAAKRIGGVAAVANDIEVRPVAEDYRLDPEIARSAVAAIRAELPAIVENTKIVVNNGRVTLEGKVEWNHQRERLEEIVRRLRGTKGITNLISVEPRVQPAEVQHLIEQAFRRSAEIDANQISVKANGGTVTLSGRVRTWSERTQAQETAWAAPGVRAVINDLAIEP
jgi:osmotically-inducible protein OsmY